MARTARWAAAGVVVVGAVIGVSACEPESLEELIGEWLRGTDTPGSAVKEWRPADGGIAAVINGLEIASESTMSDYRREDFPHWERLDAAFGFGPEFAHLEGRCTARDAVLLRDATGNVTLDPETCEFSRSPDGGWLDQYGVIDRQTGALRDYKWMTHPSDVDAEHIVALGEAWRSGANDMDVHTRRLIANDALNVVISDPSANRSKGDQDPSTYLPPGNFRCEYVERYSYVKAKYGLTVDTDEALALKDAAEQCIVTGELE